MTIPPGNKLPGYCLSSLRDWLVKKHCLSSLRDWLVKKQGMLPNYERLMLAPPSTAAMASGWHMPSTGRVAMLFDSIPD